MGSDGGRSAPDLTGLRAPIGRWGRCAAPALRSLRHAAVYYHTRQVTAAIRAAQPSARKQHKIAFALNKNLAKYYIFTLNFLI